MIRLPVALVGAGHRARSVYAPLITGTLADRFELVGVVSRREASARALGEAAGCPGAVELQLAWGARGLICSASAHENGRLAASLASYRNARWNNIVYHVFQSPLRSSPLLAPGMSQCSPLECVGFAA